MSAVMLLPIMAGIRDRLPLLHVVILLITDVAPPVFLVGRAADHLGAAVDHFHAEGRSDRPVEVAVGDTTGNFSQSYKSRPYRAA